MLTSAQRRVLPVTVTVTATTDKLSTLKVRQTPSPMSSTVYMCLETVCSPPCLSLTRFLLSCKTGQLT